MKEFLIYTGLRLGLFLSTIVVVLGVWLLVADEVPILWAVVISFGISGVASYFVLDRQRAAFARRVEERAKRATARFEELKAKEDSD